METQTLFFAEGKLLISARGYWFTSGGENKTFGFTPHLRNSKQQPIYPDTQVRNNLRMAASWLHRLDESFSNALLQKIFGKTGQATSALLQLTDLSLAEKSADSWTPERYKVTTRIALDSDKRTVKDNFLASHELAWLDGLQLESTLFLGYFSSEKDLELAMDLIAQAAPLAGGFGAFRSRGYGKGEVSVAWEEPEKIHCPADAELISPSEQTIFSLTSLTNLRNKPIEKDQAQVLSSEVAISGNQFRAWLVKTYYQLFRQWPQPEEMYGLRCSALLPTDKSKVSFVPAPMSVLKNEKNVVQDFWGKSEESDKEENIFSTKVKELGENFFSSKVKGLGEDYFVSNSPEPVFLQLTPSKRIRNAMEEDSFLTRENGLFVQEYIPAPVSFSGRMRLLAPDSVFAKRVWFIVNNIRPTLKSSLFSISCHANTKKTAQAAPPAVVTTPLPVSRMIANNGDSQDQLTLQSERRYNSMQNRPRRNRITVAPGSMLVDTSWVIDPSEGFGFCQWQGIQAEFKELEKANGKTDKKKNSSGDKQIEPIDISQGVSPSFAGNLRELLNPCMPENQVKDFLISQQAKLKKQKQQRNINNLDATLESCLQILELQDIKNMRQCLKAGLEVYQVKQWNKRQERP